MRGILLAAAIALASLGLSATAQAQTIVDGKTAPVFDYDQAIRERVYIPNGQDADLDGVEDRTAIEIMRPNTDGRRCRRSSRRARTTRRRRASSSASRSPTSTATALNDRWPLWYDNYFVPRGYAVILAEMDGTANSTGCAVNGGPERRALASRSSSTGSRAAIPGYKSVTGTADPMVAELGQRQVGDDRPLLQRHAAQRRRRDRRRGADDDRPDQRDLVLVRLLADGRDHRLDATIRRSCRASSPTRRTRPHCAPIRDMLSLQDGDADGNMNAFWDARNYRPNVSKVKASVFATHCFQDDNVDPDQMTEWWNGLAANNVPRKLWICREGHVDPFMIRRAEWMNQLHQWFDYWLYGVQNGIMSEPRVDIEDTKDNWSTHADWPVPGSANIDVYLQGDTQTTAGMLGARSPAGRPTRSRGPTSPTRTRRPRSTSRRARRRTTAACSSRRR